MLTGIIIAKNEEKNIGDCLKSLSFCDEIILVDDHSTDRTREIAKKTAVQVFKKRLDDDFAAQRNFALGKAKPGWVFFLDTDERINNKLRGQIERAVKTEGVVGYYLRRRDVLFGHQLRFGEIGKTKLIRLARRDAGIWQRKVHETWQVKGKVGELTAPMLHYPHQNLTGFLQEINRYSTLHAQALFEEGKKATLSQIILYPLGKFLKNYFWHWGFLDGMPGLIVALMMSFHSLLARGKLFMLGKGGPKEYQR